MAIGSRSRRRWTSTFAVVALALSVLVPLVASPSAGAASAPSEPRSVTAIGGPTTGNMTVKWLAPLTDNGSPVTRYSVTSAADGGAFGAPVDAGTSLFKRLPCLGVTSCDFRVYATNAAGTSGPSAIATGRWAVPSKIAVKTATGGAGVGKMTVTLSVPASNGGKAVTGYLYDVQVDSAGSWLGPFPILTSGPKTVDCSSMNPTGGCKYRAYAVNNVGSSLVGSALAGRWKVPSVSAVTSAIPGNPAAAATISWAAPVDSGGLAVTYSYEVSSDFGPFVAGASALPTSPRTATVECPATNNCSYRVTAHNSLGAAPVSDPLTTSFSPPGRVSNLVARVASVSNLNLGSGSPTVTATWGAPVNLGGSPVTGYQGRTCVGNCDDLDPGWNSATVVSLGVTSTWLTPCPANQITCSY